MLYIEQFLAKKEPMIFYGMQCDVRVLSKLNGVITSLIFMLQSCTGLGVSAGIRVGNALGAGNRQAAILATKVSMGFAGMGTCVCVCHTCSRL